MIEMYGLRCIFYISPVLKSRLNLLPSHKNNGANVNSGGCGLCAARGAILAEHILDERVFKAPRGEAAGARD